MRWCWAAALGVLVLAGSAGAATAAKPAKAADGVVVRVSGTGITRGDILAYFKQNLTMLHRYRMLSQEQTFLELMQQRIDAELLNQAAVRDSLDREVARGVFRFRRNAILSADFVDAVLRPAALLSDKEVEARMPFDLRTLRIRQILLETAEDAEAVRRRLASGEDFVTLAREAGTGPEARKDGLLAAYRADGGIYEPEIERYIFQLPLNEPSHVIRTGIGYAVLRVEEKREPTKLEVDLMRSRIKKRFSVKRLEEAVAKIVEAGAATAIEDEALYTLVDEWLKKGTLSTREVGRAAGNVITFAELVEWLPALNLPEIKDGSVMAWHEQLKNALKFQLDDSIVAAEAKRSGRVPGPAAEFAIRFHLREATLAEFQKRTVLDKVTVGEQELRPYWEAHRAEFDMPEGVEVRHLVVDGQAEAAELLARIRAGETLASLAEKYSKDEKTRVKGGLLGFVPRGRTVPEFEQAAFALRKPGDVVPAPVKTRFGYHLIELVNRREARSADFNRDREAVRRRVRAEREKELRDQVLERLRKAGKVEMDEQELSTLREQFYALMNEQAKPRTAPPAHH